MARQCEFAGPFYFEANTYSTVSTFKTNIFPITSLRGIVTATLAGLGSFFAWVAFETVDSGRFALPAFLSFFLLGFAFILQVSHHDFAADKDGQRYRHFSSLLGIPVGQWYELPIITGVVMKHFSEMPIARGRGSWQVQNYLHYAIVMLSTTDGNHRGIIVHKFPYRNKSQAVALTLQLASYFAVEARFYDIN
jgi:hypothetical protein